MNTLEPCDYRMLENLELLLHKQNAILLSAEACVASAPFTSFGATGTVGPLFVCLLVCLLVHVIGRRFKQLTLHSASRFQHS